MMMMQQKRINPEGAVEDNNKLLKKKKKGLPMPRESKKLNNYIPSDLMIDNILPRLPALSLLNFKSVCKLWSSIPRDAAFIHTHLQHSCDRPTEILLFRSRKYTFDCHEIRTEHSFYSLDIENKCDAPRLLSRFYLQRSSKYVMQQSCSGLVCFTANNTRYLCNPITQDLVRVECAYNHSVAGFGFDPVTGKYKLLCGDKEKTHYVITLGLPDSGWRQVEDMPCLVNKYCKSAYLDGRVNWITEDLEGLLSFSFEQEKYSIIPLPEYTSQDDCTLFLIVGGGYLHLITRRSTGGIWRLECWKLNDFNNQVWTYELNFDLPLDNPTPTPVRIQNGNVVISQGRKLYAYNLERNVLREIRYRYIGSRFDNWLICPNFKGSLISISDFYIKPCRSL